ESVTDPKRLNRTDLKSMTAGGPRPQGSAVWERRPSPQLAQGTEAPRIIRPQVHDSWRSETPRVCCLGTPTLASTGTGNRSPKGLQTECNGRQPHGSGPRQGI
ncbi:hypothetical protein PanWU01x14_000830, partial [Parasponia andersonii]